MDAQTRIVGAIDAVLASSCGRGDVAVVSHGAVGALLLCHLRGIAITRAEDQPGGGGGNLFRFDSESRRVIGGWTPIETA